MSPGDQSGGRAARREIDRLVAELFAGVSAPSDAARAPVDVYLAEGPPPALTVELDVAGVDPGEVEITLVEDTLVVRGVRRRPAGRRAYHHAEIAWGPFERRVRVNVPVDVAAIDASYERGMLVITLPIAPARPSRQVGITVRTIGEPA